MSSTEIKPSVDVVEQLQDPVNGNGRLRYKSYKKKYNKMRHVFKDRMRVSNVLFDEEQKAIKVAQRLQEQNDQLLDLLLEVNDSHGIPPYLRYDIRSPTPSESSVPALEPDIVSRRTLEIENARAALGEAKTELMTGQISPNSYRHIESALNETLHKSISLSELNSMSHTTLETIPRDDLPHDLGDSLPAGYLSMEHEEEYLATLDAALGGTIQPRPESHPIRSNERDKDVSLRNPVSVYNWLRKHQPQVFLQDSDSSPEKPPPKLTSTAKASKRSSIAPKQEAQVLDDEGYLVSGIAEGSSRSKRKRDDEPYRPKGGSSRPSKRKKISGGNTERKDTGEEEGL